MNTSKIGPAAGPITVAATAALIAVVGRTMRVVGVDTPTWWLPITVAAIGSVALFMTRRRSGQPARMTWFRVGTWLAAGMWATVTLIVGLSIIGLVVLASGTILAGLLAPAFAPYTGHVPTPAGRPAR